MIIFINQLKIIYSHSYNIKLIILLIILTSLLIQQTQQTQCTINTNCDSSCFNKICQYDPSTNSFYNSSITDTSTAYHGPSCCNCSDYYYFNLTALTCTQKICPPFNSTRKMFWNYLDNQCYYTCPWIYLPYNRYMFGVNQTGNCQFQCPSNSFSNNQTRMCVADCYGIFYIKAIYQNTKQCIRKCHQYYGSGYYINKLTMMCQKCPTKHYGSITGYCQQNCSTGEYKHQDLKQCVNNCYYNGNKYYLNLTTNQCMPTCRSDYYLYLTDAECYQKCPTGTFYVNSTATNRIQCTQYCNQYKYQYSDKILYINLLNNWCQQCPQGYYGNYLSGNCQLNCPSNLFKHDKRRQCVANCYNWDSYTLNFTTNKCMQKCRSDYFIYPKDGGCYQKCPNQIYSTYSNFCYDNCSQYSFYRDDLVRKCVNSGNCSYDYSQGLQKFTDPISMSCVSKCPQNYYKSYYYKTCNKVCYYPTQYKDPQRGMCSSYLGDLPIMSESNFISKNIFIIVVSVGFGVLLIIIVVSLCIYGCFQRRMRRVLQQKIRILEQKVLVGSDNLWSSQNLKQSKQGSQQNSSKQIIGDEFMMNNR